MWVICRLAWRGICNCMAEDWIGLVPYESQPKIQHVTFPPEQWDFRKDLLCVLEMKEKITFFSGSRHKTMARVLRSEFRYFKIFFVCNFFIEWHFCKVVDNKITFFQPWYPRTGQYLRGRCFAGKSHFGEEKNSRESESQQISIRSRLFRISNIKMALAPSYQTFLIN